MNPSESSKPTATVNAPLSGQMIRLDDVPDPVFAQRVVGDGVSIDPTTQVLVAPVDGAVVHLHRAGHAVTLATDDGLDVLMHIGIDTVELGGKGFRPLVTAGSRVRAGDPLIEFDADYVATHAKSLLTQIVVTARHGTIRLQPDPPRRVQSGEVVLRVWRDTVTATPGGDVAASSAALRVTSRPVRIANPTGLHARPAGMVAALARRFTADVRLCVRGKEGNAKSVVAAMSLEIDHGDEVVVVAEGVDAQAAADEIARALAGGLGEPSAPAAPPGDRPSAPPARARTESVNANVLVGVSAASGLAVGRIVQFRFSDVAIAEHGGPADHERVRLETAIAEAKRELEDLRGRLRGEADYSKAAIFTAHGEILADPDLLDAAMNAITAGHSAEFAWRAAFTSHAERLSNLRSELLAARAQDVRDVGRRVLNRILGRSEAREYPTDSIVVAEELAPSDVAGFDRTRVLGFCTTTGGGSSHVAILARSLEMPAVAAIETGALNVADGTLAILDGTRGVLSLSPTSEAVAGIRQRTAARAERRRLELAEAHLPAVTLDGRRIEVAANAAEVGDAVRAVNVGADGIGLLRTELLFMDRVTAPTEEEQYEVYRAIVDALGPERATIIRTLDVGGDKPLAYLPIAREDNPFLGLRGLRIGLDTPEVLRTQLRAIVRASMAGPVRVMFPMVAKLDELHAARLILEEARAALGAGPSPVGIMVEVPSAALVATRFAPHVDFFSIGANDLTQYTLAMDRGHPKLARGVDALHPSILRLIDMTVQAAHQYGRWVGVCGGIAGDTQAVPILVGLGVDELSVAVPTVAAVKSQIRTLTFETCRELALRAVDAASEAEVRALTPAPPD